MSTRFVLVVVLSVTALARAEDTAFRIHTLDAASTYSACTVVDVNRDGRPDIICGGWWFEAPGWKKHFLRDVEVIRGRYDDYSNLPLDVNGDGWTDLVSANYRSGKLYWIEHPGASQGPWMTHLIDDPGPMETARLADVDGDGKIDVLPNGVKFAAWWEVRNEITASGDRRVLWTRHDLPASVAGHGIGFGDVNGDGRGDVIGTRGWLEAPADRRQDAWSWQPEFRLHRDAGIPVLVHDVDEDGDSDLVWARGHRFGLYWLEQQSSSGKRQWVQHAIDTEFSQYHSLLLADITGDDHPEVIAGRRYLGHDGKDPGEYDPLAINGYRFERGQRTWRRLVISRGGIAGFGLDPEVADLDGDGDMDLVGPGRSGLVWIENRRVDRGLHPGTERDDPRTVPPYRDHSRLLVVRDETGAEREISTPFEWAVRRGHIASALELATGDLPGPRRRCPLEVEYSGVEKMERYTRIRLTFCPEPGDRVPAYLFLPFSEGPSPAMLCLHQTTRIGKGEPAGLGGRRELHYAHELALRGYICLVPDYPSFGDYPYDFRQPGNPYVSGTMKAVWNNIRAVDLLESHPGVDPDRIGCIGHSLGGHNAIFTAVFDRRIRAIISSCGFTSFHRYRGGDLTGWASDRYMPRIRDAYENDPDNVPFDFHELVAALAPRSFFVNAPLHDDNFDVRGVREVIESATGVYDLLGASEEITARYPDCGHTFPDVVRAEAFRWLDRRLANRKR